MTFGQRLKHLRELKQLERADVAAALKMPYTTYTNYETDQREPRHGVLVKFAEYFDVSIDYLLERTEMKNTSETISLGVTVTAELIRIRSEIPLLGTIAAGKPIIAEQNIEMQICVPTDWRVDYALRVKGDSMIGAGIPSGSIVLCRQQDDVDDGQIAVCIVDGEEATLKRVKRYDNLLVLHPENPDMKDLIFRGKEKSQVKIAGLAKRVIKEIM